MPAPSGRVQSLRAAPQRLHEKAAAKPTAKRDRLTVRLRGVLGSQLAEIVKYTPAADSSEAIRRAVAVYHALIIEKLAGREPVIMSRENDGSTRNVPLFL